MIFLDTSILLAAVLEDEGEHEACLRLMRRKQLAVWTHALAETFSTLTGGRLGLRVSPALAADLIENSLLPRLQTIELSAQEYLAAIREAESAGVRGGALYDFLHLVAARRAGASHIYTLNHRHFSALARGGDPRIETPTQAKPNP